MEFLALYECLLLAAQGIWSSGEGGIRSETRRERGKVIKKKKKKKGGKRPTNDV